MIFQRQNLLFTTLCLEINRFTRLCCAFRAIEAMAWQNDFYTLVISITFSVQIEFLECLDVLYQLSIVLNSSHFASCCPTYPYLTQFVVSNKHCRTSVQYMTSKMFSVFPCFPFALNGCSSIGVRRRPVPWYTSRASCFGMLCRR